MAKFRINEMRELMNDPSNIRNIILLPKTNHREELINHLISRCGILRLQSSCWRTCQDYNDSQERNPCKDPVNYSLYYKYSISPTENKTDYLCNILFPQMLFDFLPEISPALRLADGVVVVIDYQEGVSHEVEALMRFALSEKVKPILMIDNIIEPMLKKDFEGEKMYQNIAKIIKQIETIISPFDKSDMGDLNLYPQKGNIIFSSGKHNFGFTLKDFALMYSQKSNTSVDKLIEKFWGDNYYDYSTKSWITNNKTQNGEALKRTFVSMIIEPILKLTKSIMEGNLEKTELLLGKLGVSLTPSEKESKEILLHSLSKWCNGSDCIIEAIILHLPSPKTAQQYRYAYLYDGPEDDICAKGIRECDPKGPLMVYIAKIIPDSTKLHYYGIGRVFSGTISSYQKVRIMTSKYKPGSKDNLFVRKIQELSFLAGRHLEAISDAPCGNIVGMSGISGFLLKTGTLSDCDEAFTIKSMKYSAIPLVKVALEPEDSQDLPRLIDGIKNVCRIVPLTSVEIDTLGRLYVQGCDHFHIGKLIHEFKGQYPYIKLKQGDFVTIYKETVCGTSKACLTKSPNKHNKFYSRMEPLSESVIKILEDNPYELPNTQEISKELFEGFKWDKEQARNIWAFGPENTGPNIFVDLTEGVKFLDEIKESCISAFQWTTKEGVLCEQPTRGVRMNLLDVSLHADAIHRGAGQIIPTIKRACYGCQLSAKPRLQEPVYLTTIYTPKSMTNSVCEYLQENNFTLFDEDFLKNDSMLQMKTLVPVSEFSGKIDLITLLRF